tara:strand:- start:1719 stop:2249 length:531 start_codon:yes stop_codon:yes gene_type:complete
MKKLPLLLLTITILASCSNKYVLNSRVINEYKLTYQDLSTIQYYNSHDIVLTSYDQVTSDKSTSKGNLNVSFGKEVDQVIIKAGTKGKIIKDLGEGKYAVSFEPDDSKQLVFARGDKFDVYHLQALEWKSGRGKVQYGEKTFYTHSGADECILRFKLKRKYKENRKMRVAKGNKVK